MKKKNLATAMAAAMMFGGVAPVVAHADEKTDAQQTQEAVQNQKNINEINMALADGKNVATMKYTNVYNMNGTTATKDDTSKLNDNQEILYMDGKVGDDVKSTTATYLVATKMDEKELSESKTKIEAAKKALTDANEAIEQFSKLTFNKDGKQVNVYDVKKEETKSSAQTKVTVTLTRVAGAPAEYASPISYTFTNMKLEQDAAKLDKFEDKTFDVSKKEEIVALNKAAYDLSKTYNDNNTYTKSSEEYNKAGHIDRTITVYDKESKEKLGDVVLQNYDVFKANKFEGFVNISEIKDLNSLKQPELSWAEPAVMNALYNGQLKGYEDHTLKLNGNVTRAEFARMLVQLRGESVKEADLKENFSDVNPSDWFYKDVATLASLGIVKGDGNGTFRPDDTITRQEAAVMIAKAINDGKDVDQFYSNTGKPKDTKTTFKDDKAIAIWADGAVKTLSEESAKDKNDKVINGYEDNTFRPENNITRAESIVMLTNSNARTNVAIEK